MVIIIIIIIMFYSSPLFVIFSSLSLALCFCVSSCILPLLLFCRRRHDRRCYCSLSSLSLLLSFRRRFGRVDLPRRLCCFFVVGLVVAVVYDFLLNQMIS